MSVPQEYADIVLRARGGYRALILFGSRARGDNRSDSDMDVLEVTAVPAVSYVSGWCNFSCYSEEYLYRKSIEGDLFVYHIATEGVHIAGDAAVLAEVKRRIRAPDTKVAKERVMHCVPLLAVDRQVFLQRPEKYMKLAIHLVRTWAYAEVLELDPASGFSMRAAAESLREPLLGNLADLARRSDYDDFLLLCKLLELWVGKPIYNPFLTLDGFLVNGSSTIAIALAQKFLLSNDSSRLDPYEVAALEHFE